MTLVSGAVARIASSVIMPSRTVSGSGGRPRSRITTGGRTRRNSAIAFSRLLATVTSQSASAQRYWRMRPSSSSTRRMLSFVSFMVLSRRGDGPFLRKREYDSHGRAGAGGADHVEITAHHAQQFARLVGAYAVAFCLGRAERPEQLAVNEIDIHAGTLVGDVDEELAVAAAQAEQDARARGRGFDRIVEQQLYDRGELHLCHRDGSVVDLESALDARETSAAFFKHAP